MGFWDILFAAWAARLKTYQEEKAKEEAEKKAAEQDASEQQPAPKPQTQPVEPASEPEPEPIIEPTPEPEPKPEPIDPLSDDIDPKEITFVGGPNIGEWKRKYSLEVKFSGNDIQLIQEGTSVWPEVVYGDGKVCANPWVVAKLDGKWVGASFEWMRRNSQERAKRAVHGDHIKRPHEFGLDWQPRAGEVLGFCVAGLSRGDRTNVAERTPIKTIVWK